MSPPILRIVAALDSSELEEKLARLADAWRQLLEVDCPKYHALILECRDELNKRAQKVLVKATELEPIFR